MGAAFAETTRRGSGRGEAPELRRGCAADGCDEDVLARDWCARHYHRWWRSVERADSRQDVDEVAVLRAMRGEPPEYLTVAERHLAAVALLDRGLNNPQVAARMRCTPRTVQRHRHAHRCDPCPLCPVVSLDGVRSG